MNASFSRVFLILTLWVTQVYAMTPVRLPKMLRHLETGRSTDLDKTQNIALAILANNPNISWNMLDWVINIILFGNGTKTNRFSHIATHINQIDQAKDTFKCIPGFRPLLIHLLTCSQFSQIPLAHWFQLAVALEIENTELDEAVQIFGKPTNSAEHIPNCFTYNVITNKRWIACKTLRWSSIRADVPNKKAKRIKKTLLKQKSLVHDYNQENQPQLSYQIYSHQQITQDWQEWLQEYNIPYSELAHV